MDSLSVAAPHSLPRHQRSHGLASVSLAMLDGMPRLRRLQQVGSAKAILPQIHRTTPEVVFLNTSGGLTGGDRLSYALDLGPGIRVLATTQTAERAYASGGDEARLDMRFGVAAGAHLDWLPQETILFNGASLTRETQVDLADGASCLLLETVVLGRAAMGETITGLRFADRRIVWRGGRLVHLEPTMLCDDMLGDRAAILGPARAFASLLAIGPDVEGLLAPVRAALCQVGVVAASSAFGGKLVVRIMAVDPLELRRQVGAVLAVVRRGQPLPCVWQN